MSSSKITKKFLQSRFCYNEETGEFKSININQPEPFMQSEGYLYVSINSSKYLVHRLIFVWQLGRFPEGVVDHINHKKLDNSWKNLRECSQAENCANSRISVKNTSGIKGVSLHKKTGLWRARIMSKGKEYNLGYFISKENAEKALISKRESLHKEFANHG